MTRDDVVLELASLGLSNFSEVVALVDDLGLEPRVPAWFPRVVLRSIRPRPYVSRPRPSDEVVSCSQFFKKYGKYVRFPDSDYPSLW